MNHFVFFYRKELTQVKQDRVVVPLKIVSMAKKKSNLEMLYQKVSGINFTGLSRLMACENFLCKWKHPLCILDWLVNGPIICILVAVNVYCPSSSTSHSVTVRKFGLCGSIGSHFNHPRSLTSRASRPSVVQVRRNIQWTFYAETVMKNVGTA